MAAQPTPVGPMPILHVQAEAQAGGIGGAEMGTVLDGYLDGNLDVPAPRSSQN